MSIEVRQFLGLSNESGPFESLHINQNICSPQSTLYGGCALALAIEYLESKYERNLVMASTQFIGQSYSGQALRFASTTGVNGKSFTQSTVNTYADGKHQFQTEGSLGSRQTPCEIRGKKAPLDVLHPLDCKRVPHLEFTEGFISPRFEIRHDPNLNPFSPNSSNKVSPTSPTLSTFWAQMPECLEVSAASLAILADIAPSATNMWTGQFMIASSLDNTIRILNLAQSDWILCEMELSGINHGIAHTTMNMWNEDGVLLAVASQSYILRPLEMFKQFNNDNLAEAAERIS